LTGGGGDIALGVNREGGWKRERTVLLGKKRSSMEGKFREGGRKQRTFSKEKTKKEGNM